jgi:hypothetical protein
MNSIEGKEVLWELSPGDGLTSNRIRSFLSQFDGSTPIVDPQGWMYSTVGDVLVVIPAKRTVITVCLFGRFSTLTELRSVGRVIQFRLRPEVETWCRPKWAAWEDDGTTIQRPGRPAH